MTNTVLTAAERRSIMAEWEAKSQGSVWALLIATEQAVASKCQPQEQSGNKAYRAGQALYDSSAGNFRAGERKMFWELTSIQQAEWVAKAATSETQANVQVQSIIAALEVDADLDSSAPESDHFIVENALQHGFQMLNDDGNVMAISDRKLVEFVKLYLNAPLPATVQVPSAEECKRCTGDDTNPWCNHTKSTWCARSNPSLIVAPETQVPKCKCGQPWILNTVHREHSPCWRAAVPVDGLTAQQSPAQVPEGPSFTIPDPDLDDLLNAADSLQRPHANMDTANVFMDALERVSARLIPMGSEQKEQMAHEPAAIVKWAGGALTVHIIGNVAEGDLLYRSAPSAPAKEEVYLAANPNYSPSREGTHVCTCDRYPHTEWCGRWVRIHPTTPSRSSKRHMIAKRDPATGCWVGDYAETPEQVVQSMIVPKMPNTDDRGPRDPENPDGYLEPDDQWIDRNLIAVRWLIDNHAAIRAALANDGRNEKVPAQWQEAVNEAWEVLFTYDGSHAVDQWDVNMMPSKEWDRRRWAILAKFKRLGICKKEK